MDIAKYIPILLILCILISCAKNTDNKSQNTNILVVTEIPTLISQIKTVQNPIRDAYLLIPYAIKHREAKIVIKEKRCIEEYSQFIFESINKYGIDYTISEINKGVNGIFNIHVPNNIKEYGIAVETEENVYRIFGHNDSSIIGSFFDPINVTDLSGWEYQKDVFLYNNYNAIWTDNVYSNNLNNSICKASIFWRYFYYVDRKYILYINLCLDK